MGARLSDIDHLLGQGCGVARRRRPVRPRRCVSYLRAARMPGMPVSPATSQMAAAKPSRSATMPATSAPTANPAPRQPQAERGTVTGHRDDTVPSRAARPIETASCFVFLNKGRGTKGEQSPGRIRHASLAPNLDLARLIAASVTWVAARIIYSVPRRRGGQLQSVTPFLADFALPADSALELTISCASRSGRRLPCSVGTVVG